MLSVAKLSPGQERYYERSVADGLDDYYAGRGESPGVWAGRGAGELELEGMVGEGELGRLIAGQNPRSGEQLRRHYRARQITVERIDPFTGERSLEVQKLAPVAGFDLVFSVPKSVSLLHALGDEETRRAVQEAHLRAELSRTLGVEWETPRKGWADLKGMPRRVIREFSTRRAQVEAQLKSRDAGGF